MRIPLITKYLEEKNMEYQNALLEKQVQEVQNIYLTMRGWRHDYHNHLQAMKAYVKMGPSQHYSVNGLLSHRPRYSRGDCSGFSPDSLFMLLYHSKATAYIFTLFSFLLYTTLSDTSSYFFGFLKFFYLRSFFCMSSRIFKASSG